MGIARRVAGGATTVPSMAGPATVATHSATLDSNSGRACRNTEDGPPASVNRITTGSDSEAFVSRDDIACRVRTSPNVDTHSVTSRVSHHFTRERQVTREGSHAFTFSS